MKTIKDYREASNLDYRLVKAVVRQMGLDDDDDISSLTDVTIGGANAGFSGFIYYTETMEFYAEHQDQIVAQLKEDAESFGEDMLSMIMGFNCIDSETTIDEVGETLFSTNHHDMVANCLAWYALETVANDAANMDEEG